MRNTWTLLALMALMGCKQDYNLGGDGSLRGEPNPPDLSTPVETDRIVQTTVPSVDVLWVIDDSCSMSEEQTALTTNFPKFMNFFVDSGLDYHVGVVSTDMDDFAKSGKLQPDPWSGIKYLDPDVAEPVPVFQRIADLGTWGSASEEGRGAAYSALELRADTDNAGFAREDAYLSIVVISDEDDYTAGDPIDLPNFITWLTNEKPNLDMLSFSSIVGPPGGCSSSYESGDEYLAVTAAVGGIEWSICDPNWDQVLEELGMQAAGLRREFFLSQIPIEDTLAVWVEEEGARIDFIDGLDFTYSRPRNSITFSSFVPQPLSEIYVEYEVLAGEQDTPDPAESSDTGI